ncbi:heme utilization cystosolic carrier protein HutX [Orbaceae bacterium ESL0727]|nr:heme utilization cystosolic carrier protein HutX [Orbaceae bacterium ESL0727]
MTTLSLVDFMATDPDGTLESIAADYHVSLLDVIKALPTKTLVSGDKFDEIWAHTTTWGTLTTLVHTADIIFESKGELPTGFHRHGYFNLRGKGSLSGHIKAENCQAIAMIERPFMSMNTASIIFLNQQGNAMFKIFLGRDSHRQLLADQLTAFRSLATKLAKEG